MSLHVFFLKVSNDSELAKWWFSLCIGIAVRTTIEDSLKNELNDNAKALLGGDLEIDYNRNQGNLELVNQVKEFATISQMIEFSTMLSTTGRERNKSLFTRIKTVDEKYPLYGEVDYEPIEAYERIDNPPELECLDLAYLQQSLKLYIAYIQYKEDYLNGASN